MSVGQTWNAAAYAQHGRFVATLGNAVLAVTRTVNLLQPILADAHGHWTADYFRLRFHATR